MKEKIIGVKAFKKNNGKYVTGGIGGSKKTIWELGETKEIKGNIGLCVNGFHYFEKGNWCFGIDFYGAETILCEVEVLGEIKKDTYKCVTNKMKLIKELELTLHENRNSGNRNSGDCNSGDNNSGDYNSGDYNSGDCNSRNCNSGNCNSGNRNSGNRNSGDYNSGDYNSGNRNSGDYNSGNRNSGDYNSGNRNSGNCNSSNGYINWFCTEQKHFLFDVEVELMPEELKRIDFSWFDITDKTYKEAWEKCPDQVIEVFKNIPEFNKSENKEKFFEITGIRL